MLLAEALADRQVARGWGRHAPECTFLTDDPRFLALVGRPAAQRQGKAGDEPVGHVGTEVPA